MVEKRVAGSVEGNTVSVYRLRNARGVTADILDYGATLMALEAPVGGAMRPLVLGYRELNDYINLSGYLGATVGRFGNRIGGARFTLDGREHRLDPNQGAHHLHGGKDGLSMRVWAAETSAAGDAVTFTITSPDGDQGYPGRLDATCSYSLSDDDVLRIEMSATADAPTPVNLVHHSYWNLDGGGQIDGHSVEVEADSYLPTGEGQIPTGEILPVAGTPYDLRSMRRLDAKGEPIIDFCFVLREAPGLREASGLRRAAEVLSSDGKCRMRLMTNQKAVQVYTAFKLDNKGSSGEHFGPRAGLCLETQAYPDAPNKPQFPSCILRPGETYRHVMEHRFTFPG